MIPDWQVELDALMAPIIAADRDFTPAERTRWRALHLQRLAALDIHEIPEWLSAELGGQQAATAIDRWPRRVQAAAIHEAGHAVVETVTGGRVQRIQVDLDEAGRLKGGHCVPSVPMGELGALAGGWAVVRAKRIAGDRIHEDSLEDLAQAREAIRREGRGVSGARMHKAQVEAELLVARHIAVIESVANALLSTTDGPAGSLVLEGARIEAIVEEALSAEDRAGMLRARARRAA